MVYKLPLQNHVDGLSRSNWIFQPPAVVGRDPNSQLCIEHDSISRKHCQFSINGEGAPIIKDLDSTNGTYVDDRRVQQTALMPGQLIQIGALRLQIEFTDEIDDIPKTSRPKGSVHATQPMQTLRPVSQAIAPPSKPWWRRWLS
jgi:pSer/pThr/pTyr-binding forkhead associated (FHA) protein